MPFLPWRLENGARSARPERLRLEIKRCGFGEFICALLVAAGLGVEVFIAVRNPQYGTCLERFGPVVSDALVFLGVVGEYLLSNRAQTCQEDLTRRSNELLTEANNRASTAQALAAVAMGDAEAAQSQAAEATDRLVEATGMAANASRDARGATDQLIRVVQDLGEANERAAKLEKEAAEARERSVELERITAPRRLSPEDRQGIIDFVRPRAADLKLLVQAQSSDAEAFSYARSIATAFKKGGAEKIELTVTSFMSGLVFGVHMQSDVLDLDKWQEFDKFIESPLVLSKRDLTLQITLSHFRPDLYIFVGPKVTPGTFADDDGDDRVEPTIVG